MEVELPDGTILEFPEGTDKATMRAAAQKYMARNPIGGDGLTAKDRLAMARSGELSVPPVRAAKQAEIDAQAEMAMRDPGAFNAFMAGGAQGLTLGFGDELTGGVAAGLGAIKDAVTGNFSGMTDRMSGRYAGARDTIRRKTDDAETARPWTTLAGNVVGGLIPGAAGYKAAETGLKVAAPAIDTAALTTRAGLGAATGAAEGALYGAGTADGGDMSSNAAKTALVGGLAGLGGPLALAGIGAGARAVANPISSMLNIPSATRASTAIDKMVRRAGMTADDAKRAIDDAAADGQDVFKLVDALGLSGQRGLAGIARQPGDTARQEIADFLTSRQAGQADRLGAFVGDALDAPDTAAARAAALKAARGEAADAAYSSAREGAAPVDVRGALAVIDDRIGPMQGSGIADDGISAKLTKYRSRLAASDPAKSVIKGETGIAGMGDNSAKTAVELSDFDRVLLLKQEIGDDIGAAVRAGRNNEARELKKVQDALDAALEAASPSYRAANDEFAKASRAIGAVDEGMAAAGPRIRSEDTAAKFAAMSPEQQAAFKAGYADPVIARIESAALGVNKARPLSGTKAAKDFGFLAKDPAKITRQIERENRMFETNVAALGGSKTADNMADAADMAGMSSSVVGNLFAGRWGAATQQIADKMISAGSGLNPATREIIARALMSSDPQAALAPAIARAAQIEGPRKMIEALIRSGAIRAQ